MFRTSTLSKVALACALSLPILAAVGCASLVPPEASGALKIGTNQMNKMTAPEVQALAAIGGVPLTEEQADVIVQFLVDNNIASLVDAQALIDQAAADPTSVKLPDNFLELFEDFQLPATGQPA